MDTSIPTHADQHPGRTPECVQCRYDLTGFSVGAPCPECGHEIADLYPDLEFSGLATAAAMCGGLSLFSVFFAVIGSSAGSIIGSLLLVVGFFGPAWLGTVLSLLARRAIKRTPFRFARGSMALARAGFWMSVPAVVLPLAGIGVEILRPFVYG